MRRPLYIFFVFEFGAFDAPVTRASTNPRCGSLNVWIDHISNNFLCVHTHERTVVLSF
jgi:hypothetical protein